MATHHDRSLNARSSAGRARLPDGLASASLPEPSPAQLDALSVADDEAWVRFWKDYRGYAFAVCGREHVPPQDRPDVALEIFESVKDSLKKFRPNGHEGGFVKWFRHIADRRVADYFRREKKQPHSFGGTTSRSPVTEAWYETPKDTDEPSAADILAPLLEAVRPHFAEHTWTAFEESWLKGRSVKDVAAELRTTSAAVSMGNRRIVERLRREVAGSAGSAGGAKK